MRAVRIMGALLALAAVVAAVVLGLARVRTDTTTASLLPLDDPSQQASQEAAKSFGADPVVVLAESEEPAGLLEPDQITRLVGLEGNLAKLADVAVVYGPGTVLNQVAGQAQNMLAAIIGRRDALRAAAESRAQKAGLSPELVKQAGDAAIERYDVRYGALLVRGLPAGLPTLRNPGFVRAVVFDEEGQPRQQWRFVIPRPDAVAIVVRPRDGLDQGATERLAKAVEDAVDAAGLETSRVTVTGMPVVASGLGALLRQEIPLLGCIALGLIAACYGLLPWLARRRARLLPLAATVAATLVTLAAFGWLDHPLSLGVVAFLPIVLGTGSDFPAYLVRGADRRQVLVTALAAAAGFASLSISSVPFVRDLGLALAMGVLVAVGIGLLLTTGGRAASLRASVETNEVTSPERSRQTFSPLALRSLLDHRGLAFLAAAVIAALGWFALPSLDIESQPDKLAAGVPAIEDARYAEDVIGSAGEVQILVRGDKVVTAESLSWMNEVQAVMARRFGDMLHPIASPPTLLAFLGENPTPLQIEAGLAQLPSYLRGAVIRSDGRQAVLSFGIELGDVDAQRELLADVRAAIPPTPEGITADLAGLPVVTARSYELVSESRYVDALAGIAAAGFVLLVGLRRKGDALRAITAASFATGWGFAGAWLLGVSLTPLTVALGCLATATACEFTVLLGAGRSVIQRSVLVAALAAICGYLALVFSGLSVIRDFGLFLAATVALSLLAAHTVRMLIPTRRPNPVAPRDEQGKTVEPKALVLL
ncbi:MAG TPA: RND transporter [Nocardioidaceae bacterium]|nr:RND transporter [Nocardioidaceae bacterium]